LQPNFHLKELEISSWVQSEKGSKQTSSTRNPCDYLFSAFEYSLQKHVLLNLCSLSELLRLDLQEFELKDEWSVSLLWE
ncbi:hypothetical protein Tco_0549729, partial [Tanacetum coccineum]